MLKLKTILNVFLLLTMQINFHTHRDDFFLIIINHFIVVKKGRKNTSEKQRLEDILFSITQYLYCF